MEWRELLVPVMTHYLSRYALALRGCAPLRALRGCESMDTSAKAFGSRIDAA